MQPILAKRERLKLQAIAADDLSVLSLTFKPHVKTGRRANKSTQKAATNMQDRGYSAFAGLAKTVTVPHLVVYVTASVLRWYSAPNGMNGFSVCHTR